MLRGVGSYGRSINLGLSGRYGGGRMEEGCGMRIT